MFEQNMFVSLKYNMEYSWDYKITSSNPKIRMKGDLASTLDPLDPITNAGGFITEKENLMLYSCVKRALELLEENPLTKDDLLTHVQNAPDSGKWTSHLQNLVKWGVYEYASPSNQYVFGKYKSVMKDDTYARAICNLRKTNAQSKGNNVEFKLIAGEELAKLILSIDYTQGKFRFLHTDVRNCYFQYGIGRQLSEKCAIRCGKNVLLPKVLPMGFWKACGISQSLVWGVLLARNPEEDNLGIDVLEMTEAAAFLPLQGGGFIVLIYDSILICDHKDRIRQWEKRIQRNFNRCNLVLKYLTVEQREARFMFAGIEIVGTNDGLWIHPDKGRLEKWKLKLTNEVFRNTPRTYFRFMGYLRFIHTIEGIPKWLLGRMTKFQSSLGLISRWDDEMIPWERIEEARQAILSFESTGRHRKSHIQRKGEVRYLLVDATPTRYAVWEIYEREILEKWEGNFDNETRIDKAEAYVLRLGIQLGQSVRTKYCVIGNDNVGVSIAFHNGYSRSDDVDEEIVQAGRVKDIHVVLVDVPTNENVADIGTRPSKMFLEDDVDWRLTQSWHRLLSAEKKWRATGECYTGRNEELDIVQEVPNESEDEY